MTETSHVNDLIRFAAQMLDEQKLTWRHHGTGMLQAYVSPCHRLHIWHPSLLLPGMRESGAWHDHRFSFASTVLVGRLRHVRIYEEHVGAEFAKWSIPGASSGSTEGLVKVGSGRFSWGREEVLERGACYTVPRGAFHHAHQLTGDPLAVTSVVLWDKRDDPANLLAPVGQKPRHAFDGVLTPEELKPYLAWARWMLQCPFGPAATKAGAVSPSPLARGEQ